jgi:hypothetical protein
MALAATSKPHAFAILASLGVMRWAGARLVAIPALFLLLVLPQKSSMGKILASFAALLEVPLRVRGHASEIT